MAQRFYWKQYVTDKQVTFYIADLILKPGEQIEAHCHDYYEFFVVLKGTFLERCNGQELVMQPGMDSCSDRTMCITCQIPLASRIFCTILRCEKIVMNS